MRFDAVTFLLVVTIIWSTKCSATEKAQNTSQNVAKGMSAVQAAIKTMFEMINPKPFEQLVALINKVDEFKLSYTKEAANAVGEIERLIGEGKDHYFRATESVYEYTALTERLINTYNTFKGVCDDKCRATKVHIITQIVRKGLEVTNAAIDELGKGSSNFNNVSGNVQSLKANVDMQVKILKAQINSDIESYNRIILQSKESLFYFFFKYESAAHQDAKEQIPKLASLATNVGGFLSDLMNVTLVLTSSVEKAKTKLMKASAEIRDVKIAVEDLKIFVTGSNNQITIDDFLGDIITQKLEKLKYECTEYNRKRNEKIQSLRRRRSVYYDERSNGDAPPSTMAETNTFKVVWNPTAQKTRQPDKHTPSPLDKSRTLPTFEPMSKMEQNYFDYVENATNAMKNKTIQNIFEKLLNFNETMFIFESKELTSEPNETESASDPRALTANIRLEWNENDDYSLGTDRISSEASDAKFNRSPSADRNNQFPSRCAATTTPIPAAEAPSTELVTQHKPKVRQPGGWQDVAGNRERCRGVASSFMGTLQTQKMNAQDALFAFQENLRAWNTIKSRTMKSISAIQYAPVRANVFGNFYRNCKQYVGQSIEPLKRLKAVASNLLKSVEDSDQLFKNRCQMKGNTPPPYINNALTRELDSVEKVASDIVNSLQILLHVEIN